MGFVQISLVKVRKIDNTFLQTTIFFCFLLLFVKNICFAKIVALTRTNFLTPNLTFFCCVFFHFSLAFFIIILSFHSWGIQTASVKISLSWDENLWRNQSWPLLALFSTSPWEKVSDQGPVWVRSEDKIPGSFISTYDINVWLRERSLVP